LTLVKIYDKIQDKFGAISKDSSLIEGYWQNPKTKVQYSDTNRNIWIVCDDTLTNRKYFHRLKKRLEKILKQDEIYITISQIELFR
jgi:hypothetical protein